MTMQAKPPEAQGAIPAPDAPSTPDVTPAPARQPRRLAMTRADREFLPAALEILEQPPSPVAMSLLTGLFLFAAAALAWSWLSWTDIIAVAHGKVQPAGKVKVVQPLEPGKVSAVRVQNGSEVREGDILVELDPAEAEAEARAAEAAFVSWTAETLRRTDVVAVAGGGPVAERPMAWPDEIPVGVRQREEAVRVADLRKLAADLASLDAQSAQKQAERERLVATVAAQTALIAALQERVDMRSSLVDLKAGTRAGLIDATESLLYQQTVAAGQRGQLLEAERALDAIAMERARTVRTFLAEQTTRLAEARRQADEAEQRAARARVKVDRMTLRSPAAGTVQALSVTSLGQVLLAGQEILRVVPEAAELEVEVYLENKDIGFVEAGQEAHLKVEAFPFTRYGVLDATVIRVARDAVPEADARQVEADPARSPAERAQTGAERVRNLMYPVLLTTKATHMLADGRSVPLRPGMAVSAEIRTGQRRILEYLLSPLMTTTSESLRER